MALQKNRKVIVILGFEFSGPRVSAFIIIVKVIKYKKKKKKKKTTVMNLENFMVIIDNVNFSIISFSFVFRSDIASFDRFSRPLLISSKSVSHTDLLSVFYDMIGTLIAN